MRAEIKIKSGVLKAGALAILASVALVGCVITPMGPGLYIGGPVAVAPPPMREEVIGFAPYPGYVWASGYWGWEGGRHVWRAGRWQPGRPGYRWVPHHWEEARGGWRLAGGHWER